MRRTVRAAADLGIEYLTLYSFSTENWSRPPAEVTFLLDLLRRFIRQDVAELHASGVKIKVIGERQNLDADILNLLEESENLTRHNKKLTLAIAFNYGSRQEIARAIREIAAAIACGKICPQQVTLELIGSHLDTEGMPDPDLLIRTGGEQRLSNYLLWQCAYTEFVFVNEHWPDFTRDTFERAIAEFMARDRRFGGVKAQSA